MICKDVEFGGRRANESPAYRAGAAADNGRAATALVIRGSGG